MTSISKSQAHVIGVFGSRAPAAGSAGAWKVKAETPLAFAKLPSITFLTRPRYAEGDGNGSQTTPKRRQGQTLAVALRRRRAGDRDGGGDRVWHYTRVLTVSRGTG